MVRAGCHGHSVRCCSSVRPWFVESDGLPIRTAFRRRDKFHVTFVLSSIIFEPEVTCNTLQLLLFTFSQVFCDRFFSVLEERVEQ